MVWWGSVICFLGDFNVYHSKYMKLHLQSKFYKYVFTIQNFNNSRMYSQLIPLKQHRLRIEENWLQKNIFKAKILNFKNHCILSYNAQMFSRICIWHIFISSKINTIYLYRIILYILHNVLKINRYYELNPIMFVPQFISSRMINSKTNQRCLIDVQNKK